MFVCHCVNYDATLVVAVIPPRSTRLYCQRNGTLLSPVSDDTISESKRDSLPPLPTRDIHVFCPHCSKECEWVNCPRCGVGATLEPESTGDVKCSNCQYDGSVREIRLLKEIDGEFRGASLAVHGGVSRQ